MKPKNIAIEFTPEEIENLDDALTIACAHVNTLTFMSRTHPELVDYSKKNVENFDVIGNKVFNAKRLVLLDRGRDIGITKKEFLEEEGYLYYGKENDYI